MKSEHLRVILWSIAVSGLPMAPAVAAEPQERTAPARAETLSARLPQRWAFEPIPPVKPPADARGSSTNPLDRFLCAKLREHGLEPARPADKRTLIRRATFDLLGL